MTSHQRALEWLGPEFSKLNEPEPPQHTVDTTPKQHATVRTYTAVSGCEAGGRASARGTEDMEGRCE
jgi:hypothetical protein